MSPVQLNEIRHVVPVNVVPARPVPSAGADFQSMFHAALNKVEGTRATAESRIDRFLSGEGEELHRVIMAAQQAELSFEMFQQVRNKVVQAYQEVMRMQL